MGHENTSNKLNFSHFIGLHCDSEHKLTFKRRNVLNSYAIWLVAEQKKTFKKVHDNGILIHLLTFG
jgi:hypothetical protein